MSDWRLGGRCRCCGDSFSMRYFCMERMTALGFVGLFYLEVVINVHQWPDPDEGWGISRGYFPWQWWVGFSYPVVLFSFLLAAAACDLESREIPLRLTLTGTAIGFVGAMLTLWPLPPATRYLKSWFPNGSLGTSPNGQVALGRGHASLMMMGGCFLGWLSSLCFLGAMPCLFLFAQAGYGCSASPRSGGRRQEDEDQDPLPRDS